MNTDQKTQNNIEEKGSELVKYNKLAMLVLFCLL